MAAPLEMHDDEEGPRPFDRSSLEATLAEALAAASAPPPPEEPPAPSEHRLGLVEALAAATAPEPVAAPPAPDDNPNLAGLAAADDAVVVDTGAYPLAVDDPAPVAERPALDPSLVDPSAFDPPAFDPPVFEAGGFEAAGAEPAGAGHPGLDHASFDPSTFEREPAPLDDEPAPHLPVDAAPAVRPDAPVHTIVREDGLGNPEPAGRPGGLPPIPQGLRTPPPGSILPPAAPAPALGGFTVQRPERPGVGGSGFSMGPSSMSAPSLIPGGTAPAPEARLTYRPPVPPAPAPEAPPAGLQLAGAPRTGPIGPLRPSNLILSPESDPEERTGEQFLAGRAPTTVLELDERPPDPATAQAMALRPWSPEDDDILPTVSGRRRHSRR